MRKIAAGINTPRQSYEHTTIWAWLHSPEGVPPGETYTTDLNQRLATVLELKPELLATAFEGTRRKATIASATPAQAGHLRVLRMLVAEPRRESWTREELLKVIDDIQGR